MNTDPEVGIRQCCYGERIIDFGRRRVIDRERAHVRNRQIGYGRTCNFSRKRNALGKCLRDETIEVILVR